MPVLELDDGTILTEVVAICDYLESQCSRSRRLLGSTPLERASVLMWNAKVEQLGLWAMAEAFRNSVKGLSNQAVTGPDSYPQIPELAERGRQRVARFFERLDDELAERDFLAGSFYSMADISALVVVDFAAWIKIAVPEEAVNLKRWYGAVASRPSAVG